MKEKLESKITEIIEYIIGKEPQDITYNDYRILDNKLANIKYEEQQLLHNKDFSELMAKTFGYCSSNVPPKSLSEEREE